ncbi:threonine/serine ThrE exporter family protein [Agrobacterium sp. 16-2014-1-2a]
MNMAQDFRAPRRRVPVPAARAAHLAARIGRLLYVNGADAQHVAHNVTEVAGYLGHTAHVLVTSEGILVTVGSEEQFSTKVGHEVTATGVDMGKLLQIQQIVDEMRFGVDQPAMIERRINAAETDSGGYPEYVVVLGVAVTTGSLAMLFGSTLAVAIASFVAGLVSIILRHRLPAVLPNPFAVTFLVAILSGIVAVLALRLLPEESPILALTAAGMILVPGVPLINGIREVGTGHAGNGIARLTTGIALVLAIGFALFTVGFLTGAQLPVDAGPGILPVWEDLLFSGLAASGFAILFNVPPRAFIFCVLAGMASHGLRTSLEGVGLNLPIASLIGALAAAVIARLAASIHRVPAVVFAFPGVVAMIPGSFGFRAGIGGLQIMSQGAAAPHELVANTMALAITTTVTTIAIGIGLALPLSGYPTTLTLTSARKDKDHE